MLDITMTLTTTLKELFLSVLDANCLSSIEALSTYRWLHHRSCISMSLADHCDSGIPHDGVHTACIRNEHTTQYTKRA